MATTNSSTEAYANVMHGMQRVGKGLPDVMGGFQHIHHANATDGALSGKQKELIALGIAICVRCAGCIVCHVHDAIKAGATDEEIQETVGVAILMGGGPSVVYGAEALEAMEEFKQAKDAA